MNCGGLSDGSTRRDVNEFDDPESRTKTMEATSSFGILGGWARSPTSLFVGELHWLKARFPRLHICITLTRTEPESMWQGDRGRANAALLKRFVPNLTQVPAYLCGPNEMMDSTRELLMSVGIPSERIKTEAFVSPVGNTEIKDVPLDLSSRNGKLNVTAKTNNVTSESKTKTLTFARSNLDVEISDDQSI